MNRNTGSWWTKKTDDLKNIINQPPDRRRQNIHSTAEYTFFQTRMEHSQEEQRNHILDHKTNLIIKKIILALYKVFSPTTTEWN